MSLPPPPTGQIEDGIHRLPLRVYFEDTDTAGIVYHASYLRFMERGRTEMLRMIGIDHGAEVGGGHGAYAVVDMAIKWHRPARLDNVLVVESRLVGLRAAAAVLAQDIRRDGALITSARVTAALLDMGGRLRRQPADWLARMTPLLQSEP